MGEALIRAGIWVVAIVVFGGILAYGVKSALQLLDRNMKLDERQAALQELERENATKLDTATFEERAALIRAELLQKAAEVRAATALAEHPELTEARIAAEKLVIAAGGKGRAAGAEQRGMTNDEEVGVATSWNALTDAYTVFLESGGVANWNQWVGDFRIKDSYRLSRALPALTQAYATYIQSIEEGDPLPRWCEWIGDFHP